MLSSGRRESPQQIRDNPSKKTSRYQERDEETRQEYLNHLNQIEIDKIVYVDESGIEDTIQGQWVWSLRGKQVISEVKGKKTRRVNLIAGLLTKKLLVPCVFNSSINSEGFNSWLEHHLLPELSPGLTIIIDNAQFHKSARTREIIANAKCQLRFLPPYSPDLNPIENWWAIIKARINSIIKQFDDFDQALDFVLTVY